jgi:hypothetical protein
MATAQVRLRTLSPVPRRARVSLVVWGIVRTGSLAAAIALCAVLVLAPGVGLLVFWDVLAPLLPLVLLVAPGLWRNVCPIAALNQSPRLLNLTRGRPAPRWVQRHGYLVAVGLFVGIVASRRLVFEVSGPALAALLASLLMAAFVGGVWIKGKAGWCTTLCPLMPVERLYGQAPFLTVRNSHCNPCVGCTRNCYDLNPHTAHLADSGNADKVPDLRRRLFAGVFPGLTLWLFVAPAAAVEAFQLLAFALVLSAGSFFVLDAVLTVHRVLLPAFYGAVTLNLYYAFTAPASLARLGVTNVWPARVLQTAVLGLSLVWLTRALRAGGRFDASRRPPQPLPLISAPQATATRISSGMSKFE